MADGDADRPRPRLSFERTRIYTNAAVRTVGGRRDVDITPTRPSATCCRYAAARRSSPARAQGFGAAIATRLAEAGANVVIADRDAHGAKAHAAD